jgi:hypothetical protein
MWFNAMGEFFQATSKKLSTAEKAAKNAEEKLKKVLCVLGCFLCGEK